MLNRILHRVCAVPYLYLTPRYPVDENICGYPLTLEVSIKYNDVVSISHDALEGAFIDNHRRTLTTSTIKLARGRGLLCSPNNIHIICRPKGIHHVAWYVLLSRFE